MIDMIVIYGLFFVIPIIVTVLFVISLVMFITAKVKEKKVPGTYYPETIKARLIFLIVMSAIVVVVIGTILGFMALMASVIAYM